MVVGILHDVRHVDRWVAHTINRRLTEQWAWESLSPLLRASAEVTEQQSSRIGEVPPGGED